MSKKILIGQGILIAIVAILFLTDVIEVVSEEELIDRALAERKMTVEIEATLPTVTEKSVVVSEYQNSPLAVNVDLIDLDEIRDLVDARHFQQALDKHIWFHEESKSSAGMGGVRLSFALSSWKELGENYPPALDALKAVRNKDKDLLLSGEGGFGNFHDLFAINRTLEVDNETVDLFFILEAKYSNEDTEMFYMIMEDLLINGKHYETVRMYIGDLILKYESLRYKREQNLSYAKDSLGAERSMFLNLANETFITDVMKLISLSQTIDKNDDAIEIQKRAMAYIDNDKIKRAIQ